MVKTTVYDIQGRKPNRKSIRRPKPKKGGKFKTKPRKNRKTVKRHNILHLPPNQETNPETVSKWFTLNQELNGIDSPNKKKKIEEALIGTKDKIIYGYFWMDGCGFCTSLHPIWNGIVTQMEAEHPEYFDIDFNKEHIEEAISVLRDKGNLTEDEDITVTGFPTIFRIKNGHIKYYEGERSKESIIKWLTDS